MLEQWLFDGSMNEGLSAKVPPKVTVREAGDFEVGMDERIVNDVCILLSTALGLRSNFGEQLGSRASSVTGSIPSPAPSSNQSSTLSTSAKSPSRPPDCDERRF